VASACGRKKLPALNFRLKPEATRLPTLGGNWLPALNFRLKPEATRLKPDVTNALAPEAGRRYLVHRLPFTSLGPVTRWPVMEDKTLTPDTPNQVSRRNFIKGVIASGAVVSSAGYLWRSSTLSGQQPSAPGSVERLITLMVNGQERRVDVLKQETLATTLRYKLGLTGTKLGCDRSECGACTVLVDDVPHYSCSMLTHTLRGKKIVTIEGLAAADGTLHPVQQGVIDEQGFQCAFCMSGFIMSAVGYLKTNPNPTRAELAHGISGNLCRCQDYDKILTAMMRGAENLRRA
jgi:aerobic-type carbon monoxide dehydrogenase small subunit (CoxS/CutS family)